MTLRGYRTFQAMILAALGIFLLAKVYDGQILLYINQRFVILVLLSALCLLGLAQVVLRERPAAGTSAAEQPVGRSVWTLWLVALPVLAGLLVPEHPPGAAVLSTRGVTTAAGLTARSGSGLDAAAVPSAQRTVLDWIRIFNEGYAAPGEMADIVGFVYHDAQLAENQFLVGRFSITCCVTDAVAVGMLVSWPDSASLADNRWVRVRGPVQSFVREGRSLPMIAAQQVEIIPEPEQPYIFP